MDMNTVQLKLCALPHNTTAKYQPNDQGVINATNSIYRREMMGKMLASSDKQAADTEEETVARHAREAAARRGSLGVDDGRSPHVLYAMKLLKVAFFSRCRRPPSCDADSRQPACQLALRTKSKSGWIRGPRCARRQLMTMPTPMLACCALLQALGLAATPWKTTWCRAMTWMRYKLSVSGLAQRITAQRYSVYSTKRRGATS